MVKVDTASEEKIDNYDELLNAAIESAEKQVKQLVTSFASDVSAVRVVFKEG